MSTPTQTSNPTEPIQIVILGKYALMASHIANLLHPRIYITHFLKPTSSSSDILRTILQGENCELDAVILGWAWDREKAEKIREDVYGESGNNAKRVAWLIPDEASRAKGAGANVKGMAGMDESVRLFAKEAAGNIDKGLKNVKEQGGWGKDGIWEY